MLKELTVTIASHYFMVTQITPRARPAIDAFIRPLVQYGMERVPGGRYVRTALKVFAASTGDRSEYRFHINQLKDFKLQLAKHYLKEDMVNWVNEPIPEAEEVELIIQPHWIDRPHQPPIIEYITAPQPTRKMVQLGTGRGKSYTSMKGISIIGYRPIIIVRPMYLDKWVEDITRTYDIDPEDIMVVRGSNQLQALLMMAEDGILTSKIILLSNKTYQNWIKTYEKFQAESLNMGYACLPQDMCKFLRAGFRLIDEVHQDFHLNFKIDLYTNVKTSLSLSATMKPDDAFLENMYELAYPIQERYKGKPAEKYIAAIGVFYRFAKPHLIRCKGGQGTYSHVAFEESLMRHKDMMRHYIEFIDTLLGANFRRGYKEGETCAVYVGSIEFCTILTEYFKKKYPDKIVNRYTSLDPYEDFLSAEYLFTTHGKFGAALDKAGLKVVVDTVAMRTTQGNFQGIGRLREMKDGTTPRYVYLTCEDIPKHIDYHERKMKIFQDTDSVVKYFHSERYNTII